MVFQIAKLKIAGMVVSCVVGAVFLSLVSGLWNPTWNPFKIESGDIFIESLGKALDAKSFNLSGLLEIDAETTATALGADSSQPKNIKIALKLQEQIDKTDTKNIKAQAQINLGMETEGVTISGDLEARGFGDNAYFKIVSLPPFLPLPIDIEQIKGQWIKLSVRDLQNKLAAAGLQLPAEDNSQDFQATLKGLQEIVKGKNLFEIKRRLGKEDVLGMSAEHYSMALDKRAVKDFITAFLDLIEKSAPADQKEEATKQVADLNAEVAANFDKYWETLGGLTFDIWVEQGTGRLVKLKWEKEIDPAKLGSIQEDIKKMKLRIELGLSQFNEKFDIEEPADFKTAEELLGALIPAGNISSTTSTSP